VDRSRAAAASALFFAVAPGIVAGVVPFLLTRWHAADEPLAVRAVGVVMIVASLPLLVSSFVRFVVDGRGTPAPVAPTEHLVVTGAYRHVRNPMYVAVVGAIVGQAVLLGSVVLLVYAVVALATMAAFAHVYEEPTLAARYGAEYDAYRAAVPAWLPRWTPYRR
jgi:protein-S-isoprenylcysteine O-methyltransferase Ste14